MGNSIKFFKKIIDIPFSMKNHMDNFEYIYHFNKKHPDCKLNHFVGYPNTNNNSIYLSIGENENHDTQIKKYIRFL